LSVPPSFCGTLSFLLNPPRCHFLLCRSFPALLCSPPFFSPPSASPPSFACSSPTGLHRSCINACPFPVLCQLLPSSPVSVPSPHALSSFFPRVENGSIEKVCRDCQFLLFVFACLFAQLLLFTSSPVSVFDVFDAFLLFFFILPFSLHLLLVGPPPFSTFFFFSLHFGRPVAVAKAFLCCHKVPPLYEFSFMSPRVILNHFRISGSFDCLCITRYSPPLKNPPIRAVNFSASPRDDLGPLVFIPSFGTTLAHRNTSSIVTGVCLSEAAWRFPFGFFFPSFLAESSCFASSAFPTPPSCAQRSPCPHVTRSFMVLFLQFVLWHFPLLTPSSLGNPCG